MLARFRASLVERFGGRLERVVLFGSRARGAGHEESDLDVLVLVRSLTPAERRDVLDLAYDLEVVTSLPISPVVRDARTWTGRTAFGREILREGIAL